MLPGSFENACYPPIQLVLAQGDFIDAYLVISFGENGWQADGISFYSNLERSYYPMDSEFFNGAKYTTSATLYDSYGNSDLRPVSQFCEVDTSKKDWGISLGWKKAGEIEEIVDSEPVYFVTDVYDYRIEVTDLFTAADEAVKEGDVAYMIDCVDFSVAEAVYDGAVQAPKVTAALKGTELTEGVDYKVLYDGSSAPGSAQLTVIGIGNFYGALGLTYTIEDLPAVKIDGTEIDKENYTVDADTGNVTLTEEYVKTLTAGDHTMTVIFSGTETTTNFTVDPAGYNITEGSGVEWSKGGGKDLYFCTDAEAGKFSGVRIDGTEVPAENYAVDEYGAVILKDAFLKTLADGGHLLTLVFTDGEASARFIILAATNQHVISPQTGYNSHIGIWIVLMTVSAAGAICLFLPGKRQKVSGK